MGIICYLKLAHDYGGLIKSSEQKYYRVFQLLFWIAYFVFESTYIHRGNPYSNLLVALYFILLALGGFPISLILKHIYDLKISRGMSYLRKIILVIIVSFLLANVWLLEVHFLDHMVNVLYNIPANIDYIGEVVLGTMVLITWSILYLLLVSWYEIVIHEKSVEEANLLAKDAQLDVLRYQLNPHFLFNVLNSIRALVYKSPENADKMISGLSEFMRYSLSHKDDKEVSLESEISVIEKYLGIEKVRFGDNLRYNIQVDSIAEEYPIPPFIIQPLVENAVKYGMKTSAMPLEILISVEVIDDELVIIVGNSGQWYKNESNEDKAGTGTGLVNIRKRLENIYPKNHYFLIKKNNDSVQVKIRIFKKLEYLNDEKD